MSTVKLLEMLGFPGSLYALQDIILGKISLRDFFNKLDVISQAVERGVDPKSLPEFDELKRLA